MHLPKKGTFANHLRTKHKPNTNLHQIAVPLVLIVRVTLEATAAILLQSVPGNPSSAFGETVCAKAPKTPVNKRIDETNILKVILCFIAAYLKG